MEFKKVIVNNDGDYYYIDDQGKRQGECIGYWVSGNIMYMRYYKDNKLHGICTYYKINGEIYYKEYSWNGINISKKEYFQNVLKEFKREK